MPPDESVMRPHQTRRKHQQILARKQRKRQRKRRRRVARIRMWRTVNSLQFWTRTAIVFLCVAFFAFWAKFAAVYNIPADIQKGHLYGIDAYVSEKAWWFGPLSFDMAQYASVGDPTSVAVDPLTGLLTNLGPYQSILGNPRFVWIGRSGSR